MFLNLCPAKSLSKHFFFLIVPHKILLSQTDHIFLYVLCINVFFTQKRKTFVYHPKTNFSPFRVISPEVEDTYQKCSEITIKLKFRDAWHSLPINSSLLKIMFTLFY